MNPRFISTIVWVDGKKRFQEIATKLTLLLIKTSRTFTDRFSACPFSAELCNLSIRSEQRNSTVPAIRPWKWLHMATKPTHIGNAWSNSFGNLLRCARFKCSSRIFGYEPVLPKWKLLILALPISGDMLYLQGCVASLATDLPHW